MRYGRDPRQVQVVVRGGCHVGAGRLLASLSYIRRVAAENDSPDAAMHAAVLTFASDRGMLSTVARMHGIRREPATTASLDHALWFHRPPRWEGWMLFTTASHAAHNARALILGTMYGERGDLQLSVAQEGLVRVPRAAEGI